MTARVARVPLALWLLLGCLALFFLWFVQAGLVDGPDSRLVNYDLHSFFLPKFAYGSTELLHGHFPLWNPFEDGGVPFFATAQPSVLYPPKVLLFGLLPKVPAYWLYIGLHYVVLAVSFFYFLNEQGLRGNAALAGSAVWTFAVPILASNYHPNRIANLAFLPLVYLVVERIGRGERGGPRAVAALAALVGLQFLAGYPGYGLDAALLVGIHALVRPLSGPFARPTRTLPLFALAFALGAVLAAVQLVPLFEAGIIAKRASLPQDPGSLLPVARFAPAWLISVPGLTIFWLIALFERRALPATVGLFACIALGRGGWILLSHLPGFSVMRFPYLWLHICPFFTGWLTAIGWDTFERGPPETPAKNVGARLRLGAIVLMSAAWAVFSLVVIPRATTGVSLASDFWDRLARNTPTVPGIVLGVLGCMGVVALVTVRGRRYGPKAFAVVLVLLVLAHEASYPFGAIRGGVSYDQETGEMRRYEQEGAKMTGRVLSVADILLGYEIADRMPSALGAEESFLPWRFRQITEYLELWPLFAHLAWDKVAQARPFLDALDVEYVAVPKPFAADFARQARLVALRENGETVLFYNPARMGPAWVSHAARIAPTPEVAFDVVVRGHFDPHREVILEAASAPRHLPESLPEGDPGPLVTLPLAERRPTPEQMEYDVDLGRPGIFVVSESDYPGWRAFVDGQPAAILPANYAFRGVALAAGRHTVRFEYRPRSVWIGLVASLVSMFALGAFWFSRRGRPAISA
jgi:hypothetical protein